MNTWVRAHYVVFPNHVVLVSLEIVIRVNVVGVNPFIVTISNSDFLHVEGVVGYDMVIPNKAWAVKVYL